MKKSNEVSASWLAVVLTLLMTCLINFPTGFAQSAPPLLVDLDARDPSAGTLTWRNHGSLGDFTRVGHPKLETVGEVQAVAFDGVQDAYRGPLVVDAITGKASRTIEVWAYNPALDADEETLVSWGKRGGPDGSLLAFGWGKNPGYGAVAHWAADLGWNGTPTPHRWHYLVYTYDGTTARIYDNGLEKNSRRIALNTASGYPISLGAESNAQGELQFLNEYTHEQQAGSLVIATVRIRAGALTAEQISHTFDAEARRFGAVRADAEGILGKGRDQFQIGAFNLSLLRATQTAASLALRGANFDFLPADRLTSRASNGYYHLGDINFRCRVGNGKWSSYSSAAERSELPILSRPNVIAACDLTPALGMNCPLSVVREWASDAGTPVMRFRLMNHTPQPVELGALGAAMVFNNLLTGRSLEETHDHCSFADPYIGGDAGYLQVTRLNGQGPALLVLPERGTSFEAYRPLYNDPTPRGVTFEGFYEWMVHTRAYAENDWKQAQSWNRPTSRLLQPGETATYGFRFVLAPAIKAIEPTLIAQQRPVVVGIPGYVLPTDQTGHLFVHSATPIKALTVEPADALRLVTDRNTTAHGWRSFKLSDQAVGRCRLVIQYADGSQQFVHYNVIPPEAEQVRRLGVFHATRQWYGDPADRFQRTNSFMPFNRETGKLVLQHSHTWFSGLSDEIGAGASVAMAMKNMGQPDPIQVALLEKYANTALWGHLQNPDYSVRASLFYYEPKLFPNYYTVHDGWDKARTETTWRAFNYPHVTCVYWALYRLARDHDGLVRMQSRQWYLDHAYHTAMAIPQFARGLAQFGLMVGSVFPEIVRDLRREGRMEEADKLEAVMRQRTQHWASLRYPFGSEMPWDSTGQEEIYTWCRYFGYEDKAQVTLNAILGYMPTVPNWAYNGAGRRYFDAPINGTRWPDIVRMTNHYGSAINAIPVLSDYLQHPDDLYLLRVGYAGMSQLLANIDAHGFGSYGFDADPAILQFDPNTADYGIAFYGYARNAGAYVMQHPEFGWLGFGCNVQAKGNNITVEPRDGFRQRIFLAPLKLWLTLDTGTFQSVSFNLKTRRVNIVFSPAIQGTPVALLHVQQTAMDKERDASFVPVDLTPTVRDAYQIALAPKPVSFSIIPQNRTNVCARR